MAVKRCKTCSVEKPLTEFSPHAACTMGVRPECKECRRGKPALPVEQRRARLLHRYGLSTEEYEARLDAQNGGCAICGGTNGPRMLGVDHDHRSGAVRGLLCHRCNVMLGLARDRTDILMRALQYLTSA